MSDIEKFIAERKARSPKAWAKFDEKYRRYAIGMLLAEHRERAGLGLSEFARRTKMKKAAISRLENHGKDVRLSTISRYVAATGQPFALRFSPTRQPTHQTRRRTGAVVELALA
jgi:HTH-type transcriptional regulator/antitoxin HipB